MALFKHFNPISCNYLGIYRLLRLTMGSDTFDFGKFSVRFKKFQFEE